MRAVVQSAYGDPAAVLRVAEVPRPHPAADEVVVDVAATSVHADVWHVVTGLPRVLRLMGSGLRRPAPPVPGTDMAGTVVEVGTDVTGFAPGDVVFGETLRAMQWRNGAAWAEQVAAPVAALAHVPEGLDPVLAATVPTAGLIVLQNLAGHDVGDGTRALVNGAAGAVGTIALQVLRARGAHVTGVDHTDKLGVLEELGADAVVDYTTTDASASGGPYDLVVDIPCNHDIRAWQRVLAPDGRYVFIGHDDFGRTGRHLLGSVPSALGLLVRSLWTPQLRAGGGRFDRGEAVRELADLLASGALTPVVAHRFGLDDAADALRTIAEGTMGRVVLVP